MISDSKSVIDQLQKGTKSARSEAEVIIWKLIAAYTEIINTIHIQWIPGHAKFYANETTDRSAKQDSIL